MIKPLIDFYNKISNIDEQEKRIKKHYKFGCADGITLHDSPSMEYKVRAEKKSEPANIGMAMLDVISASLGIILALVVIYMNIKVIPPPPLSKDFILFETQLKGAVHMGFAVRHENSGWSYISNAQGKLDNIKKTPISNFVTSLKYSNTFKECNHPQEQYDCNSTVARLFIDQPSAGNWLIQPYFYQDREIKGIKKISKLKDIQCLYWTHFQNAENNLCEIENPVLFRKGVQIKPISVKIDK